ncbi:Target of rapamycin [Diplonema papillatum]|nr:Target of rapamycin [Diplonema papillatum]
MQNEGDAIGKVKELVTQLQNTSTPDGQLKAKKAVGETLRQLLLEVTLDRVQELAQVINLAIYNAFVQGKQVAGLLLIDELIDIDYMEAALKTTRFANYLRGALPTDNPLQAELVATTLAKLAEDGGVLSNIVVETEVARCVEWLAVVKSASDSGHRRYAAVLVMNELLGIAKQNAFSARRLELVLTHITNGLRDSRPKVQDTATELLTRLLVMVDDRSVRTRELWYTRLHDKALSLLSEYREKLVPSNAEAEACYRAGYLLLSELYSVSGSHRHARSQLLLANYDEVVSRCLNDLSTLGAALPNVLPAITRLLISTAKFQPSAFGAAHLPLVAGRFRSLFARKPAEGGGESSLSAANRKSLLDMVSAVVQLVAPTHDSQSIGVKVDTASLLAVLGDVIDEGDPVCGPAAVSCVATIAETVAKSDEGSEIYRLMSLALQRIGVTREVCGAVSRVGQAMENLQEHLFKCTLRTICAVLQQNPVPQAALSFGADPPPASPSPCSAAESPTGDAELAHKPPHRLSLDGSDPAQSFPNSPHQNATPVSEFLKGAATPLAGGGDAPRQSSLEDIKAAMTMLSQVAALSPDRMLLPNIRYSLLPYLTHDSVELRLTAVQATIDVLILTVGKNPEQGTPHCHICAATNEILVRVISTATADTSSAVRLSALRSLPPSLDHCLVQPHLIKMIVTACYDSCHHQVRLAALSLLGRLSTHNPAQIHPPLRRMLINVLNELSQRRDNAAHKLSSELLAHIMAAGPKQVTTYAVAIRDTLLKKLKTTTGSLKTEVMRTLNVLAQVSGQGLLQINDVVVAVVEALEEGKPSLQRRMACLACLASLLRCVDWATHPYEQFRQLLATLLRILQLPQPNPAAEDEIRGGVLQCLGVAGAYEPFRLRRCGAPRRDKNIIRKYTPQERGNMQLLASIAALPDTRSELPVPVPSTLIPSCGGETLASHLAQYNPVLAIRVMLQVISDTSIASSNHKMAVGAIVKIVECLDPEDFEQHLSGIYPAFLSFLKTLHGTDEPDLLSFMIQQLRMLTATVGLHARPYLSEVVEAVAQLSEMRKKLEPEILTQVLSLGIDLSSTFREATRPFASRFVSIIVVSLVQKRMTTVLKALTAVEALGGQLQGFLTVVLPAVLALLSPAVLAKIAGGQQDRKESLALASQASGSIATGVSVLGKDSRLSDEGKERIAVYKIATLALRTLVVLSRAVSLREFSTRMLQAVLQILTFEGPLDDEPAPAGRDPESGLHTSFHFPSVHSPTMMSASGASDSGIGPEKQPPPRASSVPPLSNAGDTRDPPAMLLYNIKRDAVASLCELLPNLQPEAKAMEPFLCKVVRKQGLNSNQFEAAAREGFRLAERPAGPPGITKPPDAAEGRKKFSGSGFADASGSTPDFRNLTASSRALSGIMDVGNINRPGDWVEWLRRLSLELVRESPSPAIRACGNLAQVNLSVSKLLFNTAFVSCYIYLKQPQKGSLLSAVVASINSPTVPPDVLQQLLNLAEFMEHMSISEEPTSPGTRTRQAAFAPGMDGAFFVQQNASDPAVVESCQISASIPLTTSPGQQLGNGVSFGGFNGCSADASSSLLVAGTPQGLLATTQADVVRGGNNPRPQPPPPAAPQSQPGGGGSPAAAAAARRARTAYAPLPSELSLEMLAEKSEKCQMYAKALHYRELLFVNHLSCEMGGSFGQYVDGYFVPATPIYLQSQLPEYFLEKTWAAWVKHVVKIVRLHQHLRDLHSAHGILSFALANFDRLVVTNGNYIPKVEATIYEELHQWERAKEEWYVMLQRLDIEDEQRKIGAFQSDIEGLEEQLRSLRTPDARSASPSFHYMGSHSLSSSIAGSSLTNIAATYARSERTYERKDVIRGLLRVLRSLGEWSEVLRLSGQVPGDPETAEEVARAAWMLQEWDIMESATALMNPDNIQTHVHCCVLSIQQDKMAEAKNLVLHARGLLQPDIGALASESYSRAYPLIVRLQVLAELEEVIDWKTNGGLEAHEPEQVKALLDMWQARLEVTERRARYWEESLVIRRMLIPPHRQLRSWLKYVSIARKSNKICLARNTLKMLLGIDTQTLISATVANVDPRDKNTLRQPTTHPYLICACCEYLWYKDEKDVAIRLLHDFLVKLEEAGDDSAELKVVKGKYYRKLGIWHQDRYPDSYWMPPHRDAILWYLGKSTLFDPSSWKNWHRWGLMNHRVMRRSRLDDQQIVPFVLQAGNGFQMVIQLGESSSLQDLLRLIGLWFAHGRIRKIQIGLRKILVKIATNRWLAVIPQIVARLHHADKPIRALLQQILVNLGKEHCQAIVYPLICVLCSEDPSSSRAQAARDVLDQITYFHPRLVAEGRLVATSLAKVALILAEQWAYGIDEARWLCMGERDVTGAMKTLEGLHSLMDPPPASEHEQLFHTQFSEALSIARDHLRAASKFLNPPLLSADRRKAIASFREELARAFEVYSAVQAQINDRLSKMPSLDLASANPDLSKAKNLSVAVPGTSYRTSEPVTIASFSPQCYIIPSKQRPRKITITGCNGVNYVFLLKGREDLRQDERVMQLFSLINQLLNEDRTTAKLFSEIELYPVIPLASSAGLIGWLCNTETLYSLVREYRRSHRISITQEKSLIPKMVDPSGYEKLALFQKVDVFEYILEQTKGDDLARMLWLKSRSSEIWLATRTTYTRSLAVMSMVGFIMGLGDRHPSNLMLDLDTRKVIHIDFGDCFEVASRRPKYPEQVPFRLTRMLVKAMDLAGVEGLFKRTSEDVMRVLRKNKDSLMSILSSFLHDPLINWRLIDPGKLREPVDAQRTTVDYNQLLFRGAEDASSEECASTGDEGDEDQRNPAKPSEFLGAIGVVSSADLGSEDDELLEGEGAPSFSIACTERSDLHHRSVRELAVRSLISRNTQQTCQQVVMRQGIEALQRIRRKLDGTAFKMRIDPRESDHHHTDYTYDNYDPLFVGGDVHRYNPHKLDSDEICGECEVASAVVGCDDCNDCFCAACSEAVHSKRRNQHHARIHALRERPDLASLDLATFDPASIPESLQATLHAIAVRMQSVGRGWRARAALSQLVVSVPVPQRTPVYATPESARAEESNTISDLQALDVSEQVIRLITEATAHENLAVAYSGWCPWW